MDFKILIRRNVRKDDLPQLKEDGLYKTFLKIVRQLRENPYARVNHWEVLEPRHKFPPVYSMRINDKHRVVYTIDKATKEVFIWSAYNHYNGIVKKIKK